MAINSTSSATSAAAAPTTGPGKGSVIDVAGLVSKLEQIEQVPIDRLNVKVTKQDNALRDMGIIKERMSSFQAALQDFTDPISYINKTVTSSNAAVVSATVANSSQVAAGVFNVSVTKLAKTATAMYAFTIPSSGSFNLGDTVDSSKLFSFTNSDTLESIKNKINLETANTNVRAAVVNTGDQYVLSLTSTVGGFDSQILFDENTPNISQVMRPEANWADPDVPEPAGQLGADAEFSINGQTFTRSSNAVDEALVGVRLQLQSIGDVSVVAATDNREIAKNLLLNVGQAFNDLMNSYTEFSKFNSDPEKRGSLYGFMDLRTLMDKISLSFMDPLERSDVALTDSSNGRISFTTLGLELQTNGTLLFKSNIFESAVNRGALEQIANGSVSPTRAIVNESMTPIVGTLEVFLGNFEKEKSTLENRIQDFETRKAEKMARYQAQYAALDALLYRLQALNSSLTPTFEALNNPRR
jgi:flagellar hook-associated protein 2